MRTGFLLSARARAHHFSGTGALSIKSFRGGRARYQAGTARYAVDDDTYLVLNEGQPYSIEIESPTPVTSFCVFFPSGMADQVARGLTATTASLLDDPTRAGHVAPFYERTYRHDHELSPLLRRLENEASRRGDDALWLEEALHQLMGTLLTVHERARAEVIASPLHALRGSTRDELYRRLHRARDLVEAEWREPLTLADIARVACLSENHLLRTYKQLFGVSPGAALRSARLAHARRLVESTAIPVTRIALEAGYESPSTFSTTFSRHFGVSPAELRRKAKR
jgi:AraC family transcriptional regulator